MGAHHEVLCVCVHILRYSVMGARHKVQCIWVHVMRYSAYGCTCHEV